MTPDESAASLAFATQLQENMITPQEGEQQGDETPMEGQGTPETPEMPQGEEQMPETTNFQPEPESPAEDISEPQEEAEPPITKDDLESFKTDITKMLDDKVGDLTKTIKDALKD